MFAMESFGATAKACGLAALLTQTLAFTEPSKALEQQATVWKFQVTELAPRRCLLRLQTGGGPDEVLGVFGALLPEVRCVLGVEADTLIVNADQSSVEQVMELIQQIDAP